MSLTARSPTGRKRKSWLNRTLVVWREAVGIDDCCAVLAFANIAGVASFGHRVKLLDATYCLQPSR
jgi:hypothetical protein